MCPEKTNKPTKKKKVITLEFTAYELNKISKFVEDSEFTTRTSFIREAIDVYMSNPEIRNPTTENSDIEEIRESFNRFMEGNHSQIILDNQLRIINLLESLPPMGEINFD